MDNENQVSQTPTSNTYTISGMTCGGCENAVKNLLLRVKGVRHVEVSLERGDAIIESDNTIALSTLKAALSVVPSYNIEEK